MGSEYSSSWSLHARSLFYLDAMPLAKFSYHNSFMQYKAIFIIEKKTIFTYKIKYFSYFFPQNIHVYCKLKFKLHGHVA